MLSFITGLIAEYPWAVVAVVAFAAILGTVAYLILLERKVASWVQDRIGPNRVGPAGLLQPMADGLKFFVKEDYRAAGTDRVLFTIAPALMMVVAVLSYAVIPWGGVHQVTRQLSVSGRPDPAAAARQAVPWTGRLVEDPRIEQTPAGTVATITYRYPVQVASLNIGVLFIVAVLSLAVYGVVMGGWASNNKYSFLGGMRAAAQMISYEVPLALSLLAVVLMFGTLDLNELSDKQAHYWGGVVPAWNAFCQPVAFLMFLVCLHAEANRAPFDLAEAEQELVGGYHTEYSSMRFAFFFLSEYAMMITTSAVCVALFFGGWHFPGLGGTVAPGSPAVTDSLGLVLLRCAVYFAKVLALLFVFMWVRWSLPRFRFDQLMRVSWRGMVPLALALLLGTGVVVYLMGSAPHRAYMRVGGRMALALLAMNVVILAAAMAISHRLPAAPNRRERIPGSRFEQTPLPAGS